MDPMGGVFKAMLVLTCAAGLAGCAEQLARTAKPDEGLLPPVLNPVTKINKSLREMPPPEQRVAIAVYGYTDQTGQFKPADTVQSMSRAVTQGATSVLIKALQDAGDGRWFTVVEREKLENLLKERRIIADMRERYLGEKELNAKALPPLLFAGVLLEGGIIGYDSNTRTGGAGARYLGIGGDIQYREDTVTMYLRAISTKTGEVMVSVVSHKTILSVGIKGSAFKFVALDKLLELEAGITHNEPDQIATQQAIEKAVHALIVEGAARGIWAFADKAYQAKAIATNHREQELLAGASPTAGKGADQHKTEVAAHAGAPLPVAQQSAPQTQQNASCQAASQPAAAGKMAAAQCTPESRAQRSAVAVRPAAATGAAVHAGARPDQWSVVVAPAANAREAAPKRSAAMSAPTEAPRPAYAVSAMRDKLSP
jgi:curli production assembly/transport component CsgG